MERACANIAAITLRLKRHFSTLLGASPGYGVEKRMTKAMDELGLLMKELEDAVVVLQIRLDELHQRRLFMDDFDLNSIHHSQEHLRFLNGTIDLAITMVRRAATEASLIKQGVGGHCLFSDLIEKARSSGDFVAKQLSGLATLGDIEAVRQKLEVFQQEVRRVELEGIGHQK